MRAKAFLDTNIVVYTFDASEPRKQDIARQLVAKALTEPGSAVVSWQVVQEFLNVATTKFAVPLTAVDARTYLHQVLVPLCEVYPDAAVYEDGLAIQDRHGFSFYDSLVLASAVRAGCVRLYSEDLQDEFRLGRLQVVNPFRQA